MRRGAQRPNLPVPEAVAVLLENHIWPVASDELPEILRGQIASNAGVQALLFSPDKVHWRGRVWKETDRHRQP